MIWPLLQRMQVSSIINRHLPADPQAEYDHGSVLTLLMAARLYSPVALVNVPKWAVESGADFLWDIPVEKLNDDALPPAHITQGRPMSDAPKDVRLIHAGLCTLVDELGPLPIFGHAVGGNQNGYRAHPKKFATS